jgi:1,6-anhydro-N-acetylmuramate kinase
VRMTALYIGIMSGTSIDGVDAALVSFDSDSHATLVSTSTVAFSSALREDYLQVPPHAAASSPRHSSYNLNNIGQLQSPSSNEIHRERLAANALALLYNEAIALLLQVQAPCSVAARPHVNPSQRCSLSAAQIVAVGAHGQTIRHVPPQSDALTPCGSAGACPSTNSISASRACCLAGTRVQCTPLTFPPRPAAAFTIQSLNGALLAERCCIDVVCDFR